MSSTQSYLKFEVSWHELSDVFDEESQYFNANEFNKNFKELEIGVKNSAQKLLSNNEELEKLISYMDLTTLSGDDTTERVEKLIEKALNPSQNKKFLQCASICIYPARVAGAAQYLNSLNKRMQMPIASVAGGFPSGQYRIESRLLEIELAIKDGATEIDTVIDRAAALEGDWQKIYSEIRQMKNVLNFCEKNAYGHLAHLKVILATGELQNNANIYKASWAAMLGGADFIKTSTGKETVNATLESAFVMCTAIQRFYKKTGKKIGFKPAGGIKTPLEAIEYRCLVEAILGEEWLEPELFRIGATTLLDAILKHIK